MKCRWYVSLNILMLLLMSCGNGQETQNAQIERIEEVEENAEMTKARKACLGERVRQNENCIQKVGPMLDEDFDKNSPKFKSFKECDEKAAGKYNECIEKAMVVPVPPK